MSANLIIVVMIALFGLAFDFTNGFHDTANAMATSIATGALPPRVAVALSGGLNFVGAFLSVAVATTIATGIVNSEMITTTAVFAGLIGAITWNLVTWLFGLPSSSSHAVIGGIIGASVVESGLAAVNVTGVLSKVLIPAFASPFIAAIAAAVAIWLALRIVQRARPDFINKGYRIGQIASASMVSLAHGTNDAQKTMGIITPALITSGTITAKAGVPIWVILTCATAIALGTYIGGWRVIRTVGHGITDVSTPQGFAAETVSSAVILGAAHLGFAVSTTQVCSGSVLGVGLGKRGAVVRWGTVGQMAFAWLITLPCAAIVGGGADFMAKRIGGLPGVLATALVAVLVFAGIYLLSRRAPVTADNVNAALPKNARTAMATQKATESQEATGS
jgi:PiT family inorganic phosphate transporter